MLALALNDPDLEFFDKILPTDDCLLLVIVLKWLRLISFYLCPDGVPGYFGRIVLNVANCGLLLWGVPYDDGLWIFFTDAEDEQNSFVLYCKENDEEEDSGFNWDRPLSLSLINCGLLFLWS